MHNEDTRAEEVQTSKSRRWLRRMGIVLAAPLAIVVAAYLVTHFLYPHWLQKDVPADAPRIAFSLDNSLVGQIGVTDVTYQRAMAKAGGRLITFRPDAAGDPNVSVEAVRALLEREKIDGVLLTGGGDIDPNLYGGSPDHTMLVHRLRDDFEIGLIQAARAANLPVLGICRGCQIINVAFGGTIRNLREEEDMKGCHLVLTGHPLEVVPGSTLAGILGVTNLAKVASLHGQAVGELAPPARIAATGPGDVVEAIEVDTPAGRGWILGLQWHPELTLDDEIQHRVFRTLVDRARIARERRRAR